MLTLKEIKDLALHAAKRTAPANYSVDSVDKALRDELRALGGSINQFMKNRYDIYEIIIQTADEIVPNKVISALSPFAEIQNVGQGQKALFKRRVGRNRAKKFITQVGLSGVYETFRLDTSTYEIGMGAIGGAATIDFERYLDGAEDMAELMEIITTGMVDAAYLEVQKALRAAVNATGRPAANKATTSTFVAEEMERIVNTVKAYGDSAVIFAPPEFISAMGPDAIVPATANAQGIYPVDDIDSIHYTGLIKVFRGTPVIPIPQSFVDENNEKTWIDPQMAYVLPTGGEKVVKIVFEGETQVNDFKNRDNSLEIEVYKKMGTAIVAHHNWAIYQNTGIPQTFESPYTGLE